MIKSATHRRPIRFDREGRLAGDPAELNVGEHVGSLGITLQTRRRERVNGIVTHSHSDSLTLSVQQSFSGCPKYIQGEKTLPAMQGIQHGIRSRSRIRFLCDISLTEMSYNGIW
jgi:hypothetical protein